MTNLDYNRRSMAAPLVAIALLLLLLIAGGIWGWRSSEPARARLPQSAHNPTVHGPLASVADWIDPPPRVLSPEELRTLRTRRVLASLRAIEYSHVPTPDEPPLMSTPTREWWEEMTRRRKRE